MTDIIFTRVYHSLEKEFGYLSKFGCIEISNGICWLAAVTRNHGLKTEIIDALPLALDNEKLAEAISKKSPKYVGISTCTLDIYATSDLAERIKRIQPNITIIVGGPHITAVPEETMRRFSAIDIGVIGEGEATIIDLIDSIEKKNNKPLSDVEGIIYREGKNILRTKPRPFIEDLDSLPLPAWDLLPDLNKHYFPPAWSANTGHTSTITTSRGCPFQCTYCDRQVFGNRARYHSAEYVMNMFKTLYFKYNINYFRIGDDNFMINKDRLFKICDIILKENLKIRWSCLARADFIESKMLQAMKKAGCWSIAFGVETGSQRIHDIEKKHIKLEQIEKGVALTRKAGIKTIGFNIIGHPTETVNDIKKTIDFNKKIKIDEFKTQFMVPFPGTEIYRDAEKYGTFNKDWEKMSVFNEPQFIPKDLTKEEMIRWNKKGFNSFYLQPRIILSYLKEIRGFGEIKKIVMGAFTIIGWKVKDLSRLLLRKNSKVEEKE